MTAVDFLFLERKSSLFLRKFAGGKKDLEGWK
jgi:hypothetical protein